MSDQSTTAETQRRPECDRCRETSPTVRWVARIGGHMCAECRRHERTS